MMKKFFLFTFLLLEAFFASSYLSARNEAAWTINQVIDRRVEILSNLRQAKYYIEQKDYVSAKSKLDRVLQLDSSNEEDKELLSQCNARIAEAQRAEKNAYDVACRNGSVKALQDFI